MRNGVALAVLGMLFVLAGRAAGDDREDVAKYVKILKTSKSNDERVSAVSDLLTLSRNNFEPIKPAVPDLVEVMKSDKNPRVRAATGWVIANTGAAARPALPLAIAIINDAKEPEDVRIGAAKVIGACGIFGIKESREALPILTTIEKAEMAKEPANRNERLLEIVSEAIRSIHAGTK
jgi:HEAT repeat protein